MNESASTASSVALERAYLLVVNIPHFVDRSGGIHLERAWHQDLLEHVGYLPSLRVASPRRHISDAHGEDLVPFTGPAEIFIALPPMSSLSNGVLTLPTTTCALLKAVGQADIVHCGVAGWPFPLGWIAAGAARWRHRLLLVVVESAPWRPADPDAGHWWEKLRGSLYELLASRVCRAADLALFTQPSYRDAMHPHGRGPAFVVPATWIHGEDIVDDVDAVDAVDAVDVWQSKRLEPVRLLFAGRLVVEKGVGVLLEALALIDADGGTIHVDFVGVGDSEAKIDAAAKRFKHVVVRRLAPVSYGAPFFSLIDRYHAVVVPSLTDEQPRILFDAAARAIPVIASATAGIRPHVTDGQTGILTKPGDVESLVGALRGPGSNAAVLEVLGKRSLRNARGATHTAMHARRRQLIDEHLGSSLGQRRR